MVQFASYLFKTRLIFPRIDVPNVSFSTGTYKPVNSSSLPWAKPFYKSLSNEAVYLSTRTELNHRNYTVCKMDMQVKFLRCKHKRTRLYVGEDGLTEKHKNKLKNKT